MRARRGSPGTRARAGISGCFATSGSSGVSTTRKLVLEALEVRKKKTVSLAGGLVTLRAEPVGPEVERFRRADARDDPMDHPIAGAALRDARELEEREVGAGAALLVRVEEVVDGRIILVHGLLDEPQPEEPGVEVDVPARVCRDAGDVMDPLELHDSIVALLEPLLGCSPT